ncbi:MAG TPA: hypothetical protein VH741_08225 [Candidatus Limnocylindrales bacterium]
MAASRPAPLARLLTRVAGPPDPWASLALIVAFALIAATGSPPRAVPLQLFIIGALALASFRWPVGPLAVIALLAAGYDLRLDFARAGSDVLAVTRAAIDVMLAGGNPYGVGYPVSTPPGAPFPYGPLALLWYLPAVSAQLIETTVGMAILLLLALRGRLLGLAIYATAPVLVATATDGSNDTSLGLLLLVALVLTERWPRAGAFALGLAIAFKPTALAWAAPMIGFAGWTGLLALAIGAGVLWLPALVAWGPAAIADSIVRANAVHVTPYYSLAHALQRYGINPPAAVLDVVRFGVAGTLAAISLLRVRSPQAVIGWGTAIFLVGMFGGFWSTFAYFAAVGPIVCWHLDGWLGRADSRVRLPADPVGRLGRWLDGRWSRLESSPQRRTP